MLSIVPSCLGSLPSIMLLLYYMCTCKCKLKQKQTNEKADGIQVFSKTFDGPSLDGWRITLDGWRTISGRLTEFMADRFSFFSTPTIYFY